MEPEIKNKVQNTKSNSESTGGTTECTGKSNNLPNCNLQRENIWEDAGKLKFYLVSTSAAQRLKYKSV